MGFRKRSTLRAPPRGGEGRVRPRLARPKSSRPGRKPRGSKRSPTRWGPGPMREADLGFAHPQHGASCAVDPRRPPRVPGRAQDEQARTLGLERDAAALEALDLGPPRAGPGDRPAQGRPGGLPRVQDRFAPGIESALLTEGGPHLGPSGHHPDLIHDARQPEAPAHGVEAHAGDGGDLAQDRGVREVGGDERKARRPRAVPHSGPVEVEPAAGAGDPLQPQALDEIAAAQRRARPGSGGRRSPGPARESSTAPAGDGAARARARRTGRGPTRRSRSRRAAGRSSSRPEARRTVGRGDGLALGNRNRVRHPGGEADLGGEGSRHGEQARPAGLERQVQHLAQAVGVGGDGQRLPPAPAPAGCPGVRAGRASCERTRPAAGRPRSSARGSPGCAGGPGGRSRSRTSGP